VLSFVCKYKKWGWQEGSRRPAPVRQTLRTAPSYLPSLIRPLERAVDHPSGSAVHLRFEGSEPLRPLLGDSKGLHLGMCLRLLFAKVADVKDVHNPNFFSRRIEMRLHNMAIAASLLATSLFAENPPTNTDSVRRKHMKTS